MKKNDINLFKAAGGERAKSSKRSSFFYVVVAAIVISLLAIGVAAYFNINLMNTKTEFDEKTQTLNNYITTKNNASVKAKAKEWQDIIANEEDAKTGDAYIAASSKLYPHATASEMAVVKQAILDQNSDYSVNDPEEDEPFTPWNYSQLRADLVAEEAQTDIEEENRNYFYYALQVLEKAQKKTPEDNVWSGYYRGYMVIVFTGGTPGYGISDLATKFVQGTFVEDSLSSLEQTNVNVSSPFMSLEVDDYSTVKYGYIISRDVTYNVILCPMKSIFERIFDILESTARAVLDENELSEAQKEYVAYFVEKMDYQVNGIGEGGSSEKEEPAVSFTLILPKDQAYGDFTRYMASFDGSPFFVVSDNVKEHADTWDQNSDYYSYDVTLHFTGEY